ncbi:MAG: peptidoglycan N-acetylmuramoylhydrolase [Arcobacter sp.]|nr:MAG: peptidoglycan N-acetylmuramoylhydrolase [Arcobacter sp.]
MKNISYLLIILLFFAGCAQRPSPKLKTLSYGKYKEVSFTDISSWKDEDFTKAIEIYLHTCKRTQDKKLYKLTCSKAKEIRVDDETQAKKFFEENFTPFVSLAKRSLATGYFEPLLQGSLQQSEAFPYPLYGIPDNLLRVELSKTYKQRLSHPLRGRLVGRKIKPYYTREEISNNALEELKPICFVNDKVDLFFLQVQGSGCIELEDKSILNVGYGDQNGYPYVSIGKEMINKGMLKRGEVSLESIRSYLYANPRKIDDILNANPSYIFFEPRLHSASGALGLILEAERSVAVDKRNIPLGMPIFISTIDPLSKEKFERMVFAHDTGGAIKGEARIDIFYGRGKVAQDKAGRMKNPLKLWMLVPNDYLGK